MDRKLFDSDIDFMGSLFAYCLYGKLWPTPWFSFGASSLSAYSRPYFNGFKLKEHMKKFTSERKKLGDTEWDIHIFPDKEGKELSRIAVEVPDDPIRNTRIVWYKDDKGYCAQLAVSDQMYLQDMEGFITQLEFSFSEAAERWHKKKEEE